MSISDSLFIFEINVINLKTLVKCVKFCIRSQFADVFTAFLPNANDMITGKPRTVTRKIKGKPKVRKVNKKEDNISIKPIAGQSILFASNVDTLISNMIKYPMEISLWTEIDPIRLGSTNIPWCSVFTDYLNLCRLATNSEPLPPIVTGEYFIFNEYTSKRMATIKLNLKLTYIGKRITRTLKSIPSITFKGNKTESLQDETGVIKTIYSGSTRKPKIKNKINKIKATNPSTAVERQKKNDEKNDESATRADVIDKLKNDEITDNVSKSFASLIKSETDLASKQLIELKKIKSYSSIEIKERLDTLNHIFGDHNAPYGNQVYCVGYFTVENDKNTESSKGSKVSINPGKSKSQSKICIKTPSIEKSPSQQAEYKFKTCGFECLKKREASGTCFQSVCSLDLPVEAAHAINVRKCTKRVDCVHKGRMTHKSSSDGHILLDMNSLKTECCVTQKVSKQVVGGVTAKMQIGKQPCYCSCECTFGFSTRETTYCTICGGYEMLGDEFGSPKHPRHFPCPIYYKLGDKGGVFTKMKNWSATGNDIKKKVGEAESRASRTSRVRTPGSKSIESEKDSKKGKSNKRKDDRFKFNYGYKGIPPQIGHSQCAIPCSGVLGPVPKNMGWLWTADNIPGMKPRPFWRPGATNKHVVRLLKIAKNPEQGLAKKRRRDGGKKKRPLKRPLLIVHKKDGEFTVTMETMKTFSKQRAVNQHPYEDKPVLTYTIGRTDEENRERQRRKERAQRRLEREQREFIQSAFRDMCQEICLKTYQQALEIMPHAEDPDCTCYPAHPGPDRTDLEHSCSCSDTSKASLGSDTDSDEWFVEFTPPNAKFDPAYKGKKTPKSDNSTQYTYLDYRVKLLDRFGNPVPRFFTGPDGRQQCSDLGGFWSPDKKWLEINVDGFIAPDGRWAPHNFLGPSGEQIDDDTGKFQIATGAWLVVGVDGYIDSSGRWRYYPKSKDAELKKRLFKLPEVKIQDVKQTPVVKPPEATWSCFRDISPRQLSHLGIVGHGHDRKLLLSMLEKIIAKGEKVNIPQTPAVPYLPKSKRGRRNRLFSDGYDQVSYFTDRIKCRHPVPSEKGIVAVDENGRKTYFTLKDSQNIRPKERLETLGHQGISLSSFHVPCFSSFINAEVMKQQQYERAMRYAGKGSKTVASQVGA